MFEGTSHAIEVLPKDKGSNVLVMAGMIDDGASGQKGSFHLKILLQKSRFLRDQR